MQFQTPSGMIASIRRLFLMKDTVDLTAMNHSAMSYLSVVSVAEEDVSEILSAVNSADEVKEMHNRFESVGKFKSMRKKRRTAKRAPKS